VGLGGEIRAQCNVSLSLLKYYVSDFPLSISLWGTQVSVLTTLLVAALP
jgi:hypothetical protein